MAVQIKRKYCLDEKEFLLCASFAEIDKLVSFEMSGIPTLSEKESRETVFGMMKNGFLIPEEDHTLRFSDEFSRIFRAMKESRKVLLVYHKKEEDPFAVLYCAKADYVEIQRERRGGGYIRLGIWAKEELAQWLDDEDMVIPVDLPDDLLELFVPEKAADSTEQLPEEIFGRLECRELVNMEVIWTLRICRKLFLAEICLEKRGKKCIYMPYSLSKLAEQIRKEEENDGGIEI